MSEYHEYYDHPHMNMEVRLRKWVEDFAPTVCPFAKKAWEDHKVAIQPIKELETLPIYRRLLEDPWDADLVILYCEKMFTPEEIESYVERVNEKLMPLDYVVLEDHPHVEEIVDGVDMSWGRCILFFIQRLTKLNQKAECLIETGYYDNWSMENLEDVVLWRFKDRPDIAERLRSRISGTETAV